MIHFVLTLMIWNSWDNYRVISTVVYSSQYTCESAGDADKKAFGGKMATVIYTCTQQ